MTITWIGCSPSNFKAGRDGIAPNLITLHWMAGRLPATDATFQDGRRQASAHYGIEDGTVHQYVKEEDTSFNCGVWEANLRSISVEHSGGPNLPISTETYNTSIELITDICKRYGIPADTEHIKPHSFFKATQCPGTLDVTKIISEVAKRLTDAPIKIDLGVWGKMEIQAIISTLNDMKRDLTASQENGKILDGFISKWVAQWGLPVGSGLVEIEVEMSKLMLLEDRVAEYRSAIESVVGSLESDQSLLLALRAVKDDKNRIISDLNECQLKLKNGGKVIKAWTFGKYTFKMYSKAVS
jgi:hypothetical protein